MKNNPILFKLGVWTKIIWYDFVVDSFELLKVYLRKKNILCESKFKTIASLKNKYKGKRCFIVATGPSLTMEDLNRLNGEYVLGVNAVSKLVADLTYIPQYLGIQDMAVYDKIGTIIEECAIRHIFVSDELYSQKVEKKDTERFILFPLYACRHAEHGEIRPLKTDFTSDASKVVYSGYSITYSLLQIAVHMGFNEIYLLGCDCNYGAASGKDYFVESGAKPKYAASVNERLIYAMQYGKEWLEKNRPDVKVYNATRGGMLEVFPRKVLDVVFQYEEK